MTANVKYSLPVKNRVKPFTKPTFPIAVVLNLFYPMRPFYHYSQISFPLEI